MDLNTNANAFSKSYPLPNINNFWVITDRGSINKLQVAKIAHSKTTCLQLSVLQYNIQIDIHELNTQNVESTSIF